jgi:hypothetical protein
MVVVGRFEAAVWLAWPLNADGLAAANTCGLP